MAQGDGERERAAAALIREFNRLWSGPNAAALAGIEKMYDGPVTYFGKRLSQAEVLADKRAFAARWPERTYALIEDTFDIACEGDLCRVRVEVEWSSRAPDRGASSRGRAQSEVGLRWTGDRFIIVEENGRVLERY